jgi:hypothetical protein
VPGNPGQYSLGYSAVRPERKPDEAEENERDIDRGESRPPRRRRPRPHAVRDEKEYEGQ